MASFMNSLRFRLLVLVLLSTLPALVLTLYSGVEQRRLSAIGAQDEAIRLTRLAASNHASLVEGARQLLVTLAQLPDVQSIDPNVCKPFLQSLGGSYPNYEALATIDIQGDILCTSRPDRFSGNVADHDYFQNTLNSRDFLVGEFTTSEFSENIVLPFTYPIANQAGQVGSIIVAFLDMNWLNENAKQIGLPQEATLLIVDQEGKVLARYPDPEQWVGSILPGTPIVQTIASLDREGTSEVAGLDGVRRLYAFTILESNANDSVFVSVGIPTRVAYADADRILSRNLFSLGLVTLLALAVAWFMSDAFVLRQVKALVVATSRLANGDLSARANVVNDKGELGRLAVSFDQMAERLEKRESDLRYAEAKYRTLVEQIPAITYTASLEEDNRMLYISPQVEDILGFLPDEWLQEPSMWRSRLHPEDCKRVMAEISHTRHKNMPFHAEYRMLARNGTQIWVRDDALLVYDARGVPLIMQGIMLDITDRKRAETTLQTYAVQLERSNRELQDFAYIASHDLQEPLRKIQAFGERLEIKFKDVLNEEGQDYLLRMRNSAARMQNLINDLLSYSRVTTRIQPFIKIDLNYVVQEVLLDLAERIDETNGQIEVGNVPEFEADPMQMRLLFQNLISNSLKFHKPDSPPMIKISGKLLEPHENLNDRFVELEVKDNGIGFDEKYLPRIFQPFQRLHNRGEYEGSGIGLAICRKIVEMHGGSITAKSKPGQGAVFLVTLPVIQKEKKEEKMNE